MFSKNKKVTEIKDAATWCAECHAEVDGGGAGLWGRKQARLLLEFVSNISSFSPLREWASEGSKSSMHEVKVAIGLNNFEKNMIILTDTAIDMICDFGGNYYFKIIFIEKQIQMIMTSL